jgi:hypothetical protein
MVMFILLGVVIGSCMERRGMVFKPIPCPDQTFPGVTKSAVEVRP